MTKHVWVILWDNERGDEGVVPGFFTTALNEEQQRAVVQDFYPEEFENPDEPTIYWTIHKLEKCWPPRIAAPPKEDISHICTRCNGTGSVIDTDDGYSSFSTRCTLCGGSGKGKPETQ